MLAEITAKPYSINFMPDSTAEEIIQNVRTICGTVAGTVPMDRELGINGKLLDLPENTARALLSAQIIAAVRKYEPRADIRRVYFAQSDSEELNPIAVISIGD